MMLALSAKSLTFSRCSFQCSLRFDLVPCWHGGIHNDPFGRIDYVVTTSPNCAFFRPRELPLSGCQFVRFLVFSRFLVLVRQAGQSLKRITRYRDVCSEFDTTLWKLQLIDFAGLTSSLSAVEPEMPTNPITSQRMPIRRRLEEATVEPTFRIFKVAPDGPSTQMCTMKCPRCGSTASKEKPEEQFRCERCGWKL